MKSASSLEPVADVVMEVDALDQIILNWNDLKKIANFYPEEKDKFFAFMFDNSNKFLEYFYEFKDAVNLFPEPKYREKLFDYMFSHQDKFLSNMGQVEDFVKIFNQDEYREKLFNYAFNNSNNWLDSIGALETAARIFPQAAYNNKLFELLHTNNLLNNWMEIGVALRIFSQPYQQNKLRDVVFENVGHFFRNIFDVGCAIKAFPQYAVILQKKSIDDLFDENIRASNKKNYDQILDEVHKQIRQYLIASHCRPLEVCKNARLIAQGTRQGGNDFAFFKSMPNVLGIEIAAWTGFHEMDQDRKIAQENYCRPPVGKKNT